MSSYDAIPLIVALSPSHNDITRFRPLSPIAAGNHLDRAEKIPNDPRSGISGPSPDLAYANEWG